MIERVKKNDGRWHALESIEGRRNESRWVGHLEQFRHTTTSVVYYTRRGYRGRVARYVEGKWEYDHCCGGLHSKRAVATKCAERAARALNRLAHGE